jgi:hypothetical protein
MAKVLLEVTFTFFKSGQRTVWVPIVLCTYPVIGDCVLGFVVTDRVVSNDHVHILTSPYELEGLKIEQILAPYHFCDQPKKALGILEDM